MTAMRLSIGLSNAADDVNAAPVGRLLEAPLLGLATRRDNGAPLGAHRALLLAQSTELADCDPANDKLPMKEQTFKVTSTCVQCLLSEPPTQITLVGYCDFKRTLQYRLDTETALVLGSAVQMEAPNCVVTVEHMQKLSEKNAAALSASMSLEWKSVLTPLFFESQKRSSSEEAYWTPESVKKLKRLVSEPTSPAHAT